MNVEEFKLTRQRLQRENREFFNSIYNLIMHAEAVEAKAQKQYDDGYQKGLEDAWEMMRGVCLSPYEGGMEMADVIECFGKGLLKDILRRNSASEAKAKYDAWKASKEKSKPDTSEIQVGNVVKSHSGVDMVVTSILDNSQLFCYEFDGQTRIISQRCVSNTGKHYDLPWLKEKQNEQKTD